MADNLPQVAFEAGKLFEQLADLKDQLLALQVDYDNVEIPDGYNRYDCFKNLAQNIENAVCECQGQLINEGY